MYGMDFVVAYWVFLFLLPGLIADGMYQSLFSWYKGTGAPMVGSYVSIFSLSINICLNFVLIPRFGILGAAVSSQISNTSRAIILMAIYRKKTGTKINEMLIIRRSEVVCLLQGLWGAVFGHSRQLKSAQSDSRMV
jgi:O-antigen/teichoic acid export membrane protein